MSAYMNLWSSLLIVVPYLMLDVFVMINAHLKNEFRLTFAKLGPTELRLIIVVANSVLYFSPALQEWSCQVSFLGKDHTLMALDVVGMSISFILTIIYFVSLWQDAQYYGRIDPLVKKEED